MASEHIFQLIAIVLYMIAMLVIGWYAFRRTSNLTDYMLGGRSLGPAVTALSAGGSRYVWLVTNGASRCYLCHWFSGSVACDWTHNRCIFKLDFRCAEIKNVYTSVK